MSSGTDKATIKISKPTAASKKGRRDTKIPKASSSLSSWVSGKFSLGSSKANEEKVKPGTAKGQVETSTSESFFFNEAPKKSRTRPVEKPDKDENQNETAAGEPRPSTTFIVSDKLPPRPIRRARRTSNLNVTAIKPEDINTKLNFEAIIGLESQIDWLQSNLIFDVDIQKEMKKRHSFEPLKGVIFHGPEGCGKVLLVKTFVSEFNKKSIADGYLPVSLFIQNGAEMINWEEKKMVELFDKLKTTRPAILLIDKLEGLSSRTTESKTTVHPLLNIFQMEMDKLKPEDEIYLIGTTTNLNGIHSSFRQHGRFEKVLEFKLPNEQDRSDILNVHLSKWKRKPCKEILDKIVKRTSGFSGDDLRQLVEKTFSIAFNRCTSKEGGINKLETTYEDWTLALAENARNKVADANNANVVKIVNPVSTHVPGPAVETVPVPVIPVATAAVPIFPSKLIPLLGGVKPRIQWELESIIRLSLSESKEQSQPDHKLILLWNETDSGLSLLSKYLSFITSNIQQEYQIPIFELDYIDLLIDFKFKNIDTLQNTFAKIRSSEKSIIFLKFLDMDKFYTKASNLLAEKFNRLVLNMSNGKSIIIIATASSDIVTHNSDVNWIPDKVVIPLNKPGNEELRTFFANIFNPNAKFFIGESLNGKDLIKKLQHLLENTIQSTKDKDFKIIMELQQNLCLTCEKHLESISAVGFGDDSKTITGLRGFGSSGATANAFGEKLIKKIEQILIKFQQEHHRLQK